MFDTTPDSSDRLDALMKRARGRHRADGTPTVVFASAEGGSGPPGRLRRSLRRWLPAPDVPLPRRAVVVGGVVGVLLAVATALWWQRPTVEAPSDLPVAAVAVTREPDGPVVDVTGAVPTPGLVTLPGGARVSDAIAKAGGVNPGTDLAGLNLARKVADGEQIAVGVRPTADAASGGRLDINTATKEQLDALPGVGPVTAQRILDRRQRRGPFTSLDQLGEIEGIGDARLARLAELIRL
ncbi:ComEA family DNA-binding protein [Saccharothrix violaceirubra]|uniref:Competence protein ComEA n=1 Tax=Saccharothrix violaceirubra TaxID=413306 RepID=A0A7W7T7D0_9PSEU|nr:ComEA family DNA-binding protein [Saccharothrix violaceirubra]MBB4967918.1 competence protein ComEA [Saccharothrix violaceirubra]